MKRIVGLLYQLLRDVIKEVIIKAGLVVVRSRYGWVRSKWVDPWAYHAGNIIYHFGFTLWQGRMKIRVGTRKYIYACTLNCMINLSWIPLTLCSTSWTTLWWDPTLTCVPSRQRTADGLRIDGNECLVNSIKQWSIFHYNMSFAIQVCLVNKIHNFGHCKSKVAFLMWLSRQRLIKIGTLKLPHERLWGM